MALYTVSELALKSQERCHAGLTPFHHKIVFAAADVVNGDEFVVYRFPTENAFLITSLFRIYLPELDSNASPTATADIGIADSDGVVDTDLIADVDLGAAAGWDAVDAGTAEIIDVSGKYLAIEIKTAVATAAGGTVEILGAFAAGLNVKTENVK
jgi:hypothetical protein